MPIKSISHASMNIQRMGNLLFWTFLFYQYSEDINKNIIL